MLTLEHCSDQLCWQPSLAGLCEVRARDPWGKSQPLLHSCYNPSCKAGCADITQNDVRSDYPSDRYLSPQQAVVLNYMAP